MTLALLSNRRANMSVNLQRLNLTQVNPGDGPSYDLSLKQLVLHTIFGHTKMTLQSDVLFTIGRDWV